jgi:hypothetical protein
MFYALEAPYYLFLPDSLMAYEKRSYVRDDPQSCKTGIVMPVGIDVAEVFDVGARSGDQT